ncbi:hypothetical protein COT63_01870 [Candidatus Shapirobacteria bacterium CG09_land_8_20_14_0_10_38_17]|uniref:Uncharacterized protein n=1 Tax=Candidatus Shapirobacteria bacterium CG09_land_8_20_14_0_10_38_17 TaxID=1974884 RepID=A0A2H0WT23_9BACT|nr:MAG: hypothetical protein COT63_01870 [Candidatus Shapirobacteria bacterium CG09_land_8_20_14_0_10_38_17]
MTNFNEETPISNQEGKQTPEHLLSKNEIIDRLDDAVKQSEEGEISDLQLFAHAANAWREANHNPAIKSALEKEMRKRRLVLHQIAPLDIPKHGDPIRKRYNPNYWLGTEELRNDPKGFLLNRIASLKNLFESLQIT